MLIPSHLQLEPSNSRTRVPAGGINLIASIDFESDESTTATLSSSTKVLQGDDAISSAQVATPNHSNQQFSIYAITDAAANIAERYAYTAYGQPTILDGSGTPLNTQLSTLNNRYTYTAREWDATVGLFHFRARWMSGLTGRFLSRDPIGFKGGINTYEARFAMAAVDAMGLSPGHWDWYDFAFWYFFGAGSGVDLGNVGLLDEFKSVHNVAISNAKKRAMQNAFDEMGECESKGTRSKTFSGTVEEEYHKITDRYSAMGVLGEGILTLAYKCQVTIVCDDCGCPETRFVKSKGDVNCELSFSIRDAFTNPDDMINPFLGSDTYGLERCRDFCQNQHSDCIRSTDGDRAGIGYCHRELGSCRSRCDRIYRDPRLEYPFATPYPITADWTDSSSASLGEVGTCQRESGGGRR